MSQTALTSSSLSLWIQLIRWGRTDLTLCWSWRYLFVAVTHVVWIIKQLMYNAILQITECSEALQIFDLACKSICTFISRRKICEYSLLHSNLINKMLFSLPWNIRTMHLNYFWPSWKVVMTVRMQRRSCSRWDQMNWWANQYYTIVLLLCT